MIQIYKQIAHSHSYINYRHELNIHLYRKGEETQHQGKKVQIKSKANPDSNIFYCFNTTPINIYLMCTHQQQQFIQCLQSQNCGTNNNCRTLHHTVTDKCIHGVYWSLTLDFNLLLFQNCCSSFYSWKNNPNLPPEQMKT